jgi:hypothetical protein
MKTYFLSILVLRIHPRPSLRRLLAPVKQIAHPDSVLQGSLTIFDE